MKFFLFIFLLIFTTSVHGIGLSSTLYEDLIYEPGLEKEINLTVTDVENNTVEPKLTTSINSVELTKIEEKPNLQKYLLKIQVKDKLDEGIYPIKVGFIARNPNPQGMSAETGIGKLFYIVNPYETAHPYIKPTFQQIPSDRPLNFPVNIKNIGKQSGSFKIIAQIADDIVEYEKPIELKSLEEKQIFLQLKPLSPGIHNLIIKAIYDGQTTEIQHTIFAGQPELTISSAEYLPETNSLKTSVEMRYNQPIKDIPVSFKILTTGYAINVPNTSLNFIPGENTISVTPELELESGDYDFILYTKYNDVKLSASTKINVDRIDKQNPISFSKQSKKKLLLILLFTGGILMITGALLGKRKNEETT